MEIWSYIKEWRTLEKERIWVNIKDFKKLKKISLKDNLAFRHNVIYKQGLDGFFHLKQTENKNKTKQTKAKYWR